MAINFPVFIKPTDRGGGLGIDSKSVAQNYNELNLKIRSIAMKYQSDSLIEEYLPGREFSVAILKNPNLSFEVMPVELIAQPNINGMQLLGGKHKSANTEKVIEITDKILKAKVNNLAISAFSVLGARDYGRIDIRLDKNGTPQFLEANLIPSLICGYGSFPKACIINKNISYESMILNIVKLAFARYSNIHENTSESSINGVFPYYEPVLESV